MIQVKENTDTFPMEAAKEEPPNDIVADKDGRITSIVTKKMGFLVSSRAMK